MRYTKFNAGWQNVRVKAKKEKDIFKKIQIVTNYFKKENTEADYQRVMNWLNNSKLGYNGVHKFKRSFFEDAYQELKDSKFKKGDNTWEISDLTIDEAKDVLKDLRSRKYNFHFGNNIPKDHNPFVKKLEMYIYQEKK